MSGVPPGYNGGGGGYYDQKPPQGQPQQQQYYAQQPSYPPPPTHPQQPPVNQFSPPPGQQQQYFAPPPPQSPPAHQPQQPQPAQQIHQTAFNPNTPQFSHASQPSNASTGGNVVSDTVGVFNGGSYRIDHRDSNTLLTLQLTMGISLTAKPGAMVGMSPSVTLKGNMKFSFKKLVVGGDIAQSTFTGPGELMLAPEALGDIVPIHLNGGQEWSVGKDAFLACSSGIQKEYKAQGLGKAMLSGEGLFVYKIRGTGVIFITSLGAIIQKNLQTDQDSFIVDNDHLVAWNCKYHLERVASGGLISSMTAAEGVVCRFQGPGTIFIQTRSPTAFGAWIAAHTGTGSGGVGLSSFLG